MKLKSITIVGSVETDSNPADLKVFLNRDDVDFDVRSFFALLVPSLQPQLAGRDACLRRVRAERG